MGRWRIYKRNCIWFPLGAGMEESTFETFEEELRSQMQGEPTLKPIRQTQRPDTHTSKKMKEDPPMPQHIPKLVHREPSRGMSIRRALSIQSLSQIEAPWEGVTLNRCLFVAITIVLISSGFQRLYEALGETDGEEEHEEGVTLRHVSLKEKSLPKQLESSLWDLWDWVLEDDADDDDNDGDDDDEDENEESPRVKQRKEVVRGRGPRGRLETIKHRRPPEKKFSLEREENTRGITEKGKREGRKKEKMKEVVKETKGRVKRVKREGFEEDKKESQVHKKQKEEGKKRTEPIKRPKAPEPEVKKHNKRGRRVAP